jgi:Type VI secretion system/phage-baseplate injector OB domain
MEAPLMLVGLYRGVVVDADDPSGLNRLRVSIPTVAGLDSIWAHPCLPDPNNVPVVRRGQGVWVMFEAGDRSYPVWVGFYGTRAP